MKPRFIELDGRRHLWADILALRRDQLAQSREAMQPTLSEMRLHVRPAAEHSAAGRYLEPSLLDSPAPLRRLG